MTSFADITNFPLSVGDYVVFTLFPGALHVGQIERLGVTQSRVILWSYKSNGIGKTPRSIVNTELAKLTHVGNQPILADVPLKYQLAMSDLIRPTEKSDENIDFLGNHVNDGSLVYMASGARQIKKPLVMKAVLDHGAIWLSNVESVTSNGILFDPGSINRPSSNLIVYKLDASLGYF